MLLGVFFYFCLAILSPLDKKKEVLYFINPCAKAFIAIGGFLIKSPVFFNFV